MNHCSLHSWMLLICVIMLCVSSARAQVSAPKVVGVAERPEITVSAEIGAETAIGRWDEVVLKLSRPLGPGDGSLAVFVADTDVTALLETEGDVLRYVPDLLPHPAGRADVIVYRIRSGHPWEEVGRFSLRVRHRGGFDEVKFDPSLTVNNKGQLAEDTFPAPAPAPDTERRIFQDFSGQFGLQGALTRSRWSVSAQAQVVGASYQNEALRFGELRDEAPKIDLARYEVGVERGSSGFQVGHVSHGGHRHLINGFGSRGVRAGLRHRRFDASVAAMNGSRIVGWSNAIGLADPDHRILSGTFGVDVLKKRPAQLRLEGSYLSGSVLPRTGFNQGGVPDAETNTGGGVRLVAATAAQRFRVEAGYAGSRFTNPFDPSLAQNGDVVSVEEETRYAHYVEVSAGLLRNVMLAPHLAVGVDAAYRRERVDPLYRTVAAYVQADNLNNKFEVAGRVGAAAVQLAHTRSEDNLDEIPSILKTQTRRHEVSVGVPLRALVSGASGGWFSLFPDLSYGYNQTHQRGVVLPENGGFSPSHVPDQMNRIHNAGIAWQGSRWRLDYRFNAAFQDNRQEGREEADFLNQAHTVSVSVDPASWVSLGTDVSLDRVENRGSERVDRTLRLGLRSSLRPTQHLALSGSVSPTLTRNEAETVRSTNTNMRFEGAYSFQFGSGLRWPARGQVFIRYARQSSTNLDLLFDIDTEFQTWSINSGITVTLF